MKGYNKNILVWVRLQNLQLLYTSVDKLLDQAVI